MKPPRDATRTYTIVYCIVHFLYRFFCRLRVEGTENLPETGGCIVACNHTHGPDYVFLGYASPRQIYYMAKVEAFAIHPIVSRILWDGGVFPVQRGKRDLAALDKAVELVRSGYVVGMFPEGTRSPNGALTPGKTGAARISLAGNVPVVPAVVINAPAVFKNLWSRLLLRRPEVVVRFGKPLSCTADAQNQAEARAFADEIMYAMAELLPVELRGVYAGEFQQSVSASQEEGDYVG